MHCLSVMPRAIDNRPYEVDCKCIQLFDKFLFDLLCGGAVLP